jgi:hypothetical protein
MSITRKGLLLESAAIGVMLDVASAASGAEVSRDSQPHVAIKLHLNAIVPCVTLMNAQTMATAMLGKAGVRLDWPVSMAKQNEAARIIVLEITSRQPAAFHRHALGYSEPFGGGHIRIFYDRIETAPDHGTVPKLLAHVMAHEIAHALERVNYHAPEGVMKAHWTNYDIAQMGLRPLSFDAKSVEMIHKGLETRISTVQATILNRPLP